MQQQYLSKNNSINTLKSLSPKSFSPDLQQNIRATGKMENLTKNSIKISVPMINTGTKSPVTSLLIILAFYLYFFSAFAGCNPGISPCSIPYVLTAFGAPNRSFRILLYTLGNFRGSSSARRFAKIFTSEM